MKRKNGFTILELIVVCSVILVLSSFAYLPISDRLEKNALMEAKAKIKITLDNLSVKSNSYGSTYDVKLDFENKKIIISKDGNIIEDIELPKQLEYEDVNGKKIINRRTTPNGNMSKSFSVYITTKNKKSGYYKITIDTTSPTRMVFIRGYKPTEEITAYNYRDEKYENKVWIKE